MILSFRLIVSHTLIYTCLCIAFNFKAVFFLTIQEGTPMKTRLFLCFVFLSLLHLSSCTILTPKAPVKDPLTIPVEIPFYEFKNDSKSQWTKGDITLTLVPVEFTALRRTEHRNKEGFKSMLIENNKKLVKYTKTPLYLVTPENLSFVLDLKSGHNNVVNLDQSPITFMINDQKVESFLSDPDNLQEGKKKDLLFGLLPGKISKRFQITGPFWKKELASHSIGVKPNSTIKIFVHDIATKLDSSGLPVKKETFSWTFLIKSKVELMDDYIEHGEEWVRE